MPLKYLICLVVLLGGISALAEDPTPVIREEHKVIVDGIEEHWRLEWASPPNPACFPDEPDVWSTCPCNGFAFGERGDLVLVRKEPGQEEERFQLTQLFNGEFDAPGNVGEVILRRWDVDKKDMDESTSPGFASRVRARPVATVMRFGDYDHDGRATEFLLQVGTLPCGKQMSVAIGVSRHTSRLHVFSTVEHPERPLVLQDWEWESLRAAKAPTKVTDWKCGDHGSDVETELELSADEKGIHATRWEYKCDRDGRRGELIEKEIL
ncbi:MAG: hypothetical protein ACLP5H_18940 [Desulfomonilaceae bacterium]